MIEQPAKLLIQSLKKIQNQKSNLKMMVGFDGYVDYIQKAVKVAGLESRTYFDTITNISHHIAAAAGKSAQIELRTVAAKMGGNAPIMSHALGCLGTENYCISMMGVDDVHPVFKQMHTNCTLVSIGEPAVSHALEFDDGKLILSEVSSFDNVDLDYLLKVKDEKFILDIISESKLLSLVDWSNLPRCTNLWNSLYHLIKEHNVRDKIYFFDLCDPSKKTNLEILEALQVIGQFADVGKVILGLNENEALKIFYALHGVNPNDGDSIQDLQLDYLTKVSAYIFEKLEVDMLLVHPVDRSIVVTKENLFQMQGKVVSHPKILTGGGDNLNAGFCLGLLNNLSVEECMLAGMATSGAYVQNGYSPSIDDLIEYLKTFN